MPTPQEILELVQSLQGGTAPPLPETVQRARPPAGPALSPDILNFVRNRPAPAALSPDLLEFVQNHRPPGARPAPGPEVPQHIRDFLSRLSSREAPIAAAAPAPPAVPPALTKENLDLGTKENLPLEGLDAAPPSFVNDLTPPIAPAPPGLPSSRDLPIDPSAATPGALSSPTPELFERTAATEAKRRGLYGRRQIESGLGQLTEGITGLGGPGAAFRPEADTSFIDAEIARAEDALTPQDQGFLQSQGINVPEGMTYGRLSRLLPTVAASLRSTNIDAYRQKSLEIREFAAMEKDRRDRIRLGRLPPKVLQQVSDLRTVLKGLDRIDNLLSTGKVGRGPLTGRINALLQNAKLSGPEYASARAEISNLAAQNIRAISGAQASEKEVVRLREQLPDLMQPGDTFDTLLARYRVQVEAQYDSLLETHGQAGFSVEQYGRPGAPETASEVDLQPGERVAVGPEGEFALPAETDLTQYPGWTWK